MFRRWDKPSSRDGKQGDTLFETRICCTFETGTGKRRLRGKIEFSIKYLRVGFRTHGRGRAKSSSERIRLVVNIKTSMVLVPLKSSNLENHLSSTACYSDGYAACLIRCYIFAYRLRIQEMLSTLWYRCRRIWTFDEMASSLQEVTQPLATRTRCRDFYEL